MPHNRCLTHIHLPQYHFTRVCLNITALLSASSKLHDHLPYPFRLIHVAPAAGYTNQFATSGLHSQSYRLMYCILSLIPQSLVYLLGCCHLSRLIVFIGIYIYNNNVSYPKRFMLIYSPLGPSHPCRGEVACVLLGRPGLYWREKLSSLPGLVGYNRTLVVWPIMAQELERME